MKPPWLKLTEQWQETGHFGLTVPFLIGALRRWPSQPFGSAEGIEQLRYLLTSIRDEAPADCIMRLYSCDKINDLALALIASIPQFCVSFRPSNGKPPSLYVEKSLFSEDSASLSDLVSVLWLRYGEAIEAENFSLRQGAFQPFDENDEASILHAVSRADDDVKLCAPADRHPATRIAVG